MPVDIMDSRWSTLLRISPFVSTRCADSRSCTSSLIEDSLSGALSESEIASSFNSSDRFIGSPAGRGLPGDTGGRIARNACRHATCDRDEASSGKRLGQPFQPECPLLFIPHGDLHGIAGPKFAAQQSGRERILDLPLDQPAQGARAEDRVVALAREKIQHAVVRLERHLLVAN